MSPVFWRILGEKEMVGAALVVADNRREKRAMVDNRRKDSGDEIIVMGEI